MAENAQVADICPGSVGAHRLVATQPVPSIETLDLRESTIYEDFGTVETRVVGGEECDDLADLFRFANATKRDWVAG
jgi:hypothetical protein